MDYVPYTYRNPDTGTLEKDDKQCALTGVSVERGVRVHMGDGLSYRLTPGARRRITADERHAIERAINSQHYEDFSPPPRNEATVDLPVTISEADARAQSSDVALDQLGIDEATVTILQDAGIADILELSHYEDLTVIDGIGPKRAAQIKTALATYTGGD